MLQRLEVFQNRVMEDRIKLGIPTSRKDRQASAYIDIHRNRVLEDGYPQLSYLNARTLKGTIRVKFINEQVMNMRGVGLHGGRAGVHGAGGCIIDYGREQWELYD